MVKILHTGDLHLDSAFTGLTGDKSAQRRQGQRELLQAIVELGNDQGAQLLLLAGDLLDGQNAYYETARALGEILARSRAQVFISPGNHDPYRAASPYRSVTSRKMCICLHRSAWRAYPCLTWAYASTALPLSRRSGRAGCSPAFGRPRMG